MKRTLLFLIAVTITLSISGISLAAPEAMPVTLGISPRDVAADTTDIFRKPTTGLPNVGVGETIYLGQKAPKPSEGEEPPPLTGYTWSITARPRNSVAELSATDAAAVSFVPDLVGKYQFTLIVESDSGRSEPAVLTVNAANWTGTGNITGDPAVPECAACHNGQVDDKVAEVQETKHPHMFETMISGARGLYRATCVQCHTVGYNTDQTAVNHGFDDVMREEGWAFPADSAAQNANTWDNMKQSHPNTAAMANIGCENCHGPGSAHMGMTNDAKIAKTMEVSVCARCHDSGTHHFRPMQWKLSGHSRPPLEERSACSGCHSGYGFVDRIEGLPPLERDSTYLPIGCSTCHDPHSEENPYQLRTVAPVTLQDSTVVNLHNGNICANCHQSRRYAPTYVLGRITNPARFNPHGSPQTDMLVGTNAWEFGQQMESSPHALVVEGGCVGCHMAETPEDAQNQATFLKLGDHTFHMVTETGEEHVEVCAPCHGEIESFEEISAGEDWDADGTAEGVQAEIQGMIDRLTLLLPPVGEPRIVLRDAFTPNQRGAVYNINYITSDGSKGMHNPKYARSILQAAIDSDLGVEPLEGNIPLEYNLSDAYPNPFNPVSAFTYNLARDGQVSIKIFDMAGREIRTIVNSDQKAGTYRAAIDLTGKASGVYVLRMQAGSFDASKKLVLVK